MKLVFMGTPDFSVPVLQALVEAGHDVVAVYSQPPRPAGRGKKDRPSAVHKKALDLGLTVHHPTSLRTDQAQSDFASHDADMAVVVAYGLILPQAILDAPKHGCLNIHASLLPRWRGAAPIHRAIMAGDTETGVCIMQMDAGLDTGDVLLREACAIGATETTGELHDRLSEMGARMICDAIARYPQLQPDPQPETGVTYAEKIDKSEARIDWSKSADHIVRHINGLAPFPGAWDEIDGDRVKFLKAAKSDENLAAGAIATSNDRFLIGTNDATIDILRLQRAGKKPMLPQDALRGWALPDRLSSFLL